MDGLLKSAKNNSTDARLAPWKRVSIGFALGAVGFSVLAFLAPSMASSQEESPAASAITGQMFTEMVASSTGAQDLELTQVTVTSDVDLRPLGSVVTSITCRSCKFEGALLASNVLFAGTLEFVATSFDSDVDLRRASFARPAIFDQSTFAQTLDLTGARFDDLASFGDTTFLGRSSFDRARFAGLADFSTELAVPGGQTSSCPADSARFNGAAVFVATQFDGGADFHQRCFSGAVDFTRASFVSTPNFTLVTTFAGSVFDLAQFSDGGQFRIADFRSTVSFEGVTTGGRLDFERATLREQADFEGLSGSGSISLKGALVLPSEKALVMNRVAVEGLVMDVETVPKVAGPGPRLEILTLVEKTARAEGRTADANDALFELRSLESRSADGLAKLYDAVFYRTIAGYLVRPLHPLVAFLVFVALGGLVRAARSLSERQNREAKPVEAQNAQSKPGDQPAEAENAQGTSKGHPDEDDGANRRDDEQSASAATTQPRSEGRSKIASSVVVILAEFLSGVTQALDRAFTAKPNFPKPKSPDLGDTAPLRPYFVAGGRILEFVVQKLLIGLFFIGIGNANQTIKQLIDAVF